MAIGDIDRARRELDVKAKDYREAAGDYAEYLKRARERFERAEVVTVRQVREVYRRAAQRVRDAVRNVTPGTLRERHLLALAKALDEQADALRGQLDSVLRSGIQLAVDIAVQPAEQITMEALGDAFDRAGIRAMFTNVNQRAVTALLNRTRGDGLRLSDRVWRTSRSWQRAASRVIEDMVTRGQNSREAARYIDRYLQPQTHTVLKAETRRRLGVPKDVSMEAMRLAVTEMNNAFHEGTILAGRATPSYQGIHWRLSHAHVVPDVCDRLAANSPYPKGQEPEKPHPWCRCVAIQVHEDTQEFMQRLREWVNNPESQPDLEKWYQESAKPFISRPAGIVREDAGKSGSSNSLSIVHPTTAKTLSQLKSELWQRTKSTGNEHAGLFDLTSMKPIDVIMEGQHSKVSTIPLLQKMEKGNQYVHIHTHPEGSSFSLTDVLLLHDFDQIHQLVVVAGNIEYRLSRIPNRLIASPGIIEQAYLSELNKLLKPYRKKYKADRKLPKYVTNQITRELWNSLALILGLEYTEVER